jgi:hypothetical protein
MRTITSDPTQQPTVVAGNKPEDNSVLADSDVAFEVMHRITHAEPVTEAEQAAYEKPTPTVALKEIADQIIVKLKAVVEAIDDRALGKARSLLCNVITEAEFLRYHIDKDTIGSRPSVLIEAMRRYRNSGNYNPQLERLLTKVENRRQFERLFKK